jgi:hypothetical protein
VPAGTQVCCVVIKGRLLQCRDLTCMHTSLCTRLPWLLLLLLPASNLTFMVRVLAATTELWVHKRQCGGLAAAAAAAHPPLSLLLPPPLVKLSPSRTDL